MTTLKKAIAIFSLSALLSACGGGGDDASDGTVTDTSQRVTISGSVGDGPIDGATVILRNADGDFLVATTSDPQANYSVDIVVGPDDFPITLEATGGIDLVTGTAPDFILVSVVTSSASTRANLNPHSTVITRTAKFMNGGLSESNLATAKQTVTTRLNFGLDSEVVRDPITDIVDSSNAVVISHSSEALAELVRRASKKLGSGVLEDNFITALSADLTDGLLDGKGTAGANPHYAAVIHAISLQVLLESMLSDLHVNDVPAEEAINRAIDTILGDSIETANRPRKYRLNRVMFRQAISALSAIQVIDPSVTLRDLMRLLRDLEDGASIDEMIAALEQYSLDLSISSSLDSSIDETVAATEEEITDMNDAANTPDVRENIPPVISGIPAASVAEGLAYAFTPTATDPDGGSLSFTATNLPAWASLNTSNGALTGTPGFNDAGVSGNVVISVSDGSASTSLPAFAITIQDVNRAPLISGIPAASVAEGLAYAFTPTATDPDGGSLSFTATNLPAWASLNTSNGALAGTPGFNDAGVYGNVVISVSDGSASTSLPAFAITIQDVNRAPLISGIPATSVAEGSAYAFTPTATDPDGGALSFSATNLPAWASLNTSNGALAGTPGFNDAGVNSNIVISVSDGSASTSLNPFSISVGGTNQSPSITGAPSVSATENAAYSFTPSATDPDGDTLIFSAANLPVWASFDSINGTLSGTPDYADAGVYNNIVISVSDGSASTSLPAFAITVQDVNRDPVISGVPATSVAEGSAYAFTPTATDPDGGALSFSATNLPAWANLITSNGSLVGTPGFNDAGVYSNIVISVSDGSASTSLNPFSISVGETNQSPSISGAPSVSATENAAYGFTPSATDPDGDTLAFSAANLPVWASFDSINGTLSGTPDYANAGVYNNIVISVSDGSASTSLPAFAITVQDVSRDPVISGIPATSVAEGSAYAFTPTATDPDGGALSFSATNLPAWASFNTSNGALAGTPGFNDAGVYSNIVISVSDGSASTSLNPFSISVGETNQSPSISGAPSVSATENAAYSFTPSATDPDGDTLTFSSANLPVWASFDSINGTLSGTPGYADAGVYGNIVISVSDGSASTLLPAFAITVQDVSRDPVISGIPANSVAEGSAYAFTPTASDPDGGAIAFSATNVPAWASFDASNGALAGTPGFNDAGVYSNIMISVSDGSASTSLQAFAITVQDLNRVPVISGIPAASVAEGEIYSFIPSAFDPDGDSLTYTIQNLPTWVTLDPNNGTLSGTPGFDDAGSYANIIIGVTDGIDSATISPFSIIVTNTNRAPTISGNPANTVTEGELFTFTPSVSDPDGDNLTFSFVNIPAWATFNDTTGVLEGTPGTTDVGDHVNIGISVSDGAVSTALSAFNINVAPAAVYTLADITAYAIDMGDSKLNLSPRAFLNTGTIVEHTDNFAVNNTYHFKISVYDLNGSMLSNFSTQVIGYRIYLGSTSDSLNYAFDLPDGLDGNYWFSDLAVGTYYLSISAYDINGVESQLSNIAEIQVL